MTGWWEGHVLPRITDRMCGAHELDPLRQSACAGLHGDALELGFGSGLNVQHYPAAVRRVGAVEPSDLAWRLAAPRIAHRDVTVDRVGLDGQRLELDDASYDSAVSSFTLCTVPDPSAALGELRRVLRPGGTFGFVEHGLSPDPRIARWQHRLTPVQRRVAGGCHLDRDIVALVEGAGFRVERAETSYVAWPRSYGYVTVGSASAAG